MIARWRLPDKDELNAMYNVLHKNGVGGFANDFYWSSSVYNANNAWNLYFDIGFQYNYDKNLTFRVRAVRDFKSHKNYNIADRTHYGYVFHKDGNHYKECKITDEQQPISWYNAIEKYPFPSLLEILALKTREIRDNMRAL